MPRTTEPSKPNLLLQARAAAVTLLIEENLPRFNALYVQEAEKRGVTYTPEPTEEERREQELRDLLAKDPDVIRRLEEKEAAQTEHTGGPKD